MRSCYQYLSLLIILARLLVFSVVASPIVLQQKGTIQNKVVNPFRNGYPPQDYSIVLVDYDQQNSITKMSQYADKVNHLASLVHQVYFYFAIIAKYKLIAAIYR